VKHNGLINAINRRATRMAKWQDAQVMANVAEWTRRAKEADAAGDKVYAQRLAQQAVLVANPLNRKFTRKGGFKTAPADTYPDGAGYIDANGKRVWDAN
jgi:hypothetical protein